MDVLSIYAPSWDPYDSYGIIANELARYLGQRGVHVNAMHANGEVYHETQARDVQQIVRRPVEPVFGGIHLGYPTAYDRRGAMGALGPKVAITMFESTQLPEGWAEILNRCAAVIVPSRWQGEVFEACGVRVPVHVIPLGIGAAYRAVERDPERKPYTFLAIADRGRRKGWFLAAAAFAQAFGRDVDYQLVLKARVGEALFRIEAPNVTVLRQDMTEQELQTLYASADCMVFPSAGEGFGLPPREFAATGGTVIATDWSGTADDLPEWGYPLAYDLVPAWKGEPGREGLGVWARPGVDDLAQTMCYVSRRQARTLRRARQAAVNVRRLYDWGRFAEGVWDVWQEIA